MLTDSRLERLADAAEQAHSRIQQDYDSIDPVIGVSRNMRTQGVPADVMTIDCLKSGKRIILILHDQQPDSLRVQFSIKDQAPDEAFQTLPFEQLSAQQLYDWISDYFG